MAARRDEDDGDGSRRLRGAMRMRDGDFHGWLAAAAAAAIEMESENPSSDTMLKNMLKNIPCLVY